MQQDPQEQENRALQGQLHEDPAQEAHLEGAHVGIDAEAAGQVVLDLVVTELYQALAQAELREDGEGPPEHVIDGLQILRGKGRGQQSGGTPLPTPVPLRPCVPAAR